MKAQAVLRKIVALGTGATMMGATIFGAMAYDLGDYPAPFVTNGVFNGKIVVGNSAIAADVIGAIDIATSLQRAAASAVDVAGGTVTTSKGKVQDILVGSNLGDSANFGTPLDSTDLPFLADSSVNIDIGGVSNDYDYQEQIKLPTTVANPAKVTTGLTYATQSEDWKDRVFIPVGPGAVGYYYTFTSTLKANNYIVNATDNDPIKLDFLGKTLKITSATSTSITAQVGNDYFMTVGDTVTVEGKQVKLVNVASSGTTAVVEVDGTRKTVSGTETVNGLRIQVSDTFTSDTLAERSATLVIGSEATKTYNSGDEYIGENKDNPVWVWDLALLNTASPTIGVKFNLNLDNWDETDSAAYPHPLYLGDSLKFPNNFAEVKFDSMTQNSPVGYEFSADIRDLYQSSGDTTALLSSAYVVKGTVSGLSNTGFLVGSSKSDVVYLYPYSNQTLGVFYKDSSSSKAIWGANVTGTAGTNLQAFLLDYGKSTVNVTYNGFDGVTGAGKMSGNLTFDFAGIGGTGTDKLKMGLVTSAANKFSYLGIIDDDTDNALIFNGGSDLNIAGWQENTRTKDGVLIYNPDSNFKRSSGQLKFDLPKDVTDYRANVVIQGAGGVTATSSPSGAVSVNPIAVGMAVLASDAPATGNMIVVGGPCANSKAAELMGNPADCAAGFAEGQGVIKLYAAKNAILVAGATAKDTQGAARVLANYADYADKFTGKTEVTVVTTNLNNLQVMTT